MPEAGSVASQFDDIEQQRDASNLGMWIFLASEVLFFGTLVAVYALSRIRYPEAFAAASQLTNVALGTTNTGVLLSSSLTMALGVRAATLGDKRACIALLSATIMLGLAFLGIKGTEYALEYHEGLVPSVNFVFSGPLAKQVELFFWLYFVATGFHALHMIIGIGLVASMIVLASRASFNRHRARPIELSGLYWHFVDIVWIFLYPLLYLVSRS